MLVTCLQRLVEQRSAVIDEQRAEIFAHSSPTSSPDVAEFHQLDIVVELRLSDDWMIDCENEPGDGRGQLVNLRLLNGLQIE